MTTTTALVIPLLRQVDAWLEQCVESALNQTVACEVVVVTAPKTPESNRAVLDRIQARRPGLRVIESAPHMRFAAALNLGIRSTASARVGFLLTDDWLSPTAVERCQARDADIVSTRMTIFGADGVTVLDPVQIERTRSKYDKLKTDEDRARYLGHFFLFRREALEGVGGVDETIGDSPGVDDFDMIWCLLERGASVSIVEEALYCYRDHEGERLTTRRRDEMLATFNRILDKHGVTGDRRQAMVRDHSLWFGKSIWNVYQGLQPKNVPAAMKPVQSMYRALLPLPLRRTIQERFLWWWRT